MRTHKNRWAWFHQHCCTEHFDVPSFQFPFLQAIGLTLAAITLVLFIGSALSAAPHLAGASGVSCAAVMALNPDRWKQLGTPKAFSAGNDVKFNLQDLGKYRFRRWLIYFTGTYVHTGGTSSFGTLATEAPFNIVRYVTYQDRTVTKRIPMRMLRQLSHLLFRGKDTTYTAPTAANASQTIQFSCMLDHDYFGTDAPDISILDLTRAGDNATLTLTCGQLSDLLGGTVDYTTNSMTDGTFTIFGEIEESRPLRGFPFSNFVYDYNPQSISSNPQTEYKVPIALDQDVRLILCGQSTLSPDTLISTLVAAGNNIRVDVNDEPRFGPITFQELQRRNNDWYGIALSTGYFAIDWVGLIRSGKGRSKSRLPLGTPDQNDPDRIKSAYLVVQTSSVASAYLDVVTVSLRGQVVPVR